MGYVWKGTQVDDAPAPKKRKSGPAKGWVPFDPSKCGERRGYRQHNRHGQDQCDDCKAANAAYSSKRRAEVKQLALLKVAS
jgi:hypothetical protein